MRLFVALDLPDEVRSALSELITKLKPLSRGARWVPPESLHVTLKFIGWIGDDKLQPTQEILASIRSSQPVELNFRGSGFFPNERRPRVFWCGLEASPNLAEIAAALDAALVPLGIKAETRPYTPHLTLARFKSSEGVAALVKAAGSLKMRDFGGTTATNFHLYESLLKSSGAQYNRLASFPFAGGSTANAH